MCCKQQSTNKGEQGGTKSIFPFLLFSSERDCNYNRKNHIHFGILSRLFKIFEKLVLIFSANPGTEMKRALTGIAASVLTTAEQEGEHEPIAPVSVPSPVYMNYC